MLGNAVLSLISLIHVLYHEKNDKRTCLKHQKVLFSLEWIWKEKAAWTHIVVNIKVLFSGLGSAGAEGGSGCHYCDWEMQGHREIGWVQGQELGSVRALMEEAGFPHQGFSQVMDWEVNSRYELRSPVQSTLWSHFQTKPFYSHPIRDLKQTTIKVSLFQNLRRFYIGSV